MLASPAKARAITVLRDLNQSLVFDHPDRALVQLRSFDRKVEHTRTFDRELDAAVMHILDEALMIPSFDDQIISLLLNPLFDRDFDSNQNQTIAQDGSLSVSAFMLAWLFGIERKAEGKLPVTEGLWLARVRKTVRSR